MKNEARIRAVQTWFREVLCSPDMDGHRMEAVVSYRAIRNCYDVQDAKVIEQFVLGTSVDRLRVVSNFLKFDISDEAFKSCLLGIVGGSRDIETRDPSLIVTILTYTLMKQDEESMQINEAIVFGARKSRGRLIAIERSVLTIAAIENVNMQRVEGLLSLIHESAKEANLDGISPTLALGWTEAWILWLTTLVGNMTPAAENLIRSQSENVFLPFIVDIIPLDCLGRVAVSLNRIVVSFMSSVDVSEVRVSMTTLIYGAWRLPRVSSKSLVNLIRSCSEVSLPLKMEFPESFCLVSWLRKLSEAIRTVEKLPSELIARFLTPFIKCFSMNLCLDPLNALVLDIEIRDLQSAATTSEPIPQSLFCKKERKCINEPRASLIAAWICGLEFTYEVRGCVIVDAAITTIRTLMSFPPPMSDRQRLLAVSSATRSLFTYLMPKFEKKLAVKAMGAEVLRHAEAGEFRDRIESSVKRVPDALLSARDSDERLPVLQGLVVLMASELYSRLTCAEICEGRLTSSSETLVKCLRLLLTAGTLLLCIINSSEGQGLINPSRTASWVKNSSFGNLKGWRGVFIRSQAFRSLSLASCWLTTSDGDQLVPIARWLKSLIKIEGVEPSPELHTSRLCLIEGLTCLGQMGIDNSIREIASEPQFLQLLHRELTASAKFTGGTKRSTMTRIQDRVSLIMCSMVRFALMEAEDQFFETMQRLAAPLESFMNAEDVANGRLKSDVQIAATWIFAYFDPVAVKAIAALQGKNGREEDSSIFVTEVISLLKSKTAVDRIWKVLSEAIHSDDQSISESALRPMRGVLIALNKIESLDTDSLRASAMTDVMGWMHSAFSLPVRPDDVWRRHLEKKSEESGNLLAVALAIERCRILRGSASKAVTSELENRMRKTLVNRILSPKALLRAFSDVSVVPFPLRRAKAIVDWFLYAPAQPWEPGRPSPDNKSLIETIESIIKNVVFELPRIWKGELEENSLPYHFDVLNETEEVLVSNMWTKFLERAIYSHEPSGRLSLLSSVLDFSVLANIIGQHRKHRLLLLDGIIRTVNLFDWIENGVEEAQLLRFGEKIADTLAWIMDPGLVARPVQIEPEVEPALLRIAPRSHEDLCLRMLRSLWGSLAFHEVAPSLAERCTVKFPEHYHLVLRLWVTSDRNRGLPTSINDVMSKIRHKRHGDIEQEVRVPAAVDISSVGIEALNLTKGGWEARHKVIAMSDYIKDRLTVEEFPTYDLLASHSLLSQYLNSSSAADKIGIEGVFICLSRLYGFTFSKDGDISLRALTSRPEIKNLIDECPYKDSEEYLEAIANFPWPAPVVDSPSVGVQLAIDKSPNFIFSAPLAVVLLVGQLLVDVEGKVDAQWQMRGGSFKMREPLGRELDYARAKVTRSVLEAIATGKEDGGMLHAFSRVPPLPRNLIPSEILAAALERLTASLYKSNTCIDHFHITSALTAATNSSLKDARLRSLTARAAKSYISRLVPYCGSSGESLRRLIEILRKVVLPLSVLSGEQNSCLLIFSSVFTDIMKLDSAGGVITVLLWVLLKFMKAISNLAIGGIDCLRHPMKRVSPFWPVSWRCPRLSGFTTPQMYRAGAASATTLATTILRSFFFPLARKSEVHAQKTGFFLYDSAFYATGTELLMALSAFQQTDEPQMSKLEGYIMQDGVMITPVVRIAVQMKFICPNLWMDKLRWKCISREDDGHQLSGLRAEIADRYVAWLFRCITGCSPEIATEMCSLRLESLPVSINKEALIRLKTTEVETIPCESKRFNSHALELKSTSWEHSDEHNWPLIEEGVNFEEVGDYDSICPLRPRHRIDEFGPLWDDGLQFYQLLNLGVDEKEETCGSACLGLCRGRWWRANHEMGTGSPWSEPSSFVPRMHCASHFDTPKIFMRPLTACVTPPVVFELPTFSTSGLRCLNVEHAIGPY